MKDVILVGAGGHAKVIADILQQNKEYNIVGLIEKRTAKGFWGIPIIGCDEDLPILFAKGYQYGFVALGANELREQLSLYLKNIGYHLIKVISKDAVISLRASINEGVAVMPGTVINADAVIDEGCIINTNASVDHEGYIGAYTHIAPGAVIAGGVRVGEKCFLGMGTCVIQKVVIGDCVVAGASSVIINNIDSNCTVVGCPAKRFVQKW